jgi:hypothetical protein
VGLRLLRYLWALPTSCVGLPFPVLAWVDGRVAVVDGVVELSGGRIAALLRRLPPDGNVAAMALGHLVAALDEETLECTRAHERVHVAQAERWGPLFIPAYIVASLVAHARGGHIYFDNAFEQEARQVG